MSTPIGSANDAIAWLNAQGIRRVEVVFSDLTSVARGKVMHTASFIQALGAKLPTLLLGLTVTGSEPPDVFERLFPPSFPDMACPLPKSPFRCWALSPARPC